MLLLALFPFLIRPGNIWKCVRWTKMLPFKHREKKKDFRHWKWLSWKTRVFPSSPSTIIFSSSEEIIIDRHTTTTRSLNECLLLWVGVRNDAIRERFVVWYNFWLKFTFVIFAILDNTIIYETVKLYCDCSSSFCSVDAFFVFFFLPFSSFHLPSGEICDQVWNSVGVLNFNRFAICFKLCVFEFVAVDPDWCDWCLSWVQMVWCGLIAVSTRVCMVSCPQLLSCLEVCCVNVWCGNCV